MASHDESDPWRFTIVRAQGMRLMRPGKSWRPIITVEIDKHYKHETVMGVDGQNPNLKERFELQQADHTSLVEFSVWHKSPSKKKAKKRMLVASATHSLAELLKLQEKDLRAELELRLQCKSALKPAAASKGRPQNGATILLKLHPPSSLNRDFVDLTETNEAYESEMELSGAGSSTRVSEPSEPSMPPSPTDGTWPPSNVLRRRRRRGYHLNSDDEIYSVSASEDDREPSKPPIFSDGESYCGGDDDDTTLRDQSYSDQVKILRVSSPGEWIHSIWPTLLPQYTERIEVPVELSFAERILASFTTYSAMKAARTDDQYEKVFARLQTEWTYVGGLLVAMAAVSTAVFAISPDSVFSVETYARSAIAASSVSSGLGIACDAWFLLRYNWADLSTFKTRARDVYSTYFFFSLSSRLPTLCLFISALTLMLFLGLVAFSVWPMGVLLTCFAIGLVMTLQFLVFGAHWFVLRLVGIVRWFARGVCRVLGYGGGKAAEAKEDRMDGKEMGPA